ncbi:xaa-Pro aminopeptidase 3-like [Ptychodera flava]|uniref:xaa-Pro aminopeptidase 3-like n=1 Tax=Ptychodera flava TaxID=63121 RepID=UPI003969EDC0
MAVFLRNTGNGVCVRLTKVWNRAICRTDLIVCHQRHTYSSSPQIQSQLKTTAKKVSIPTRNLGQPTPYTHPHLMKYGDVTPGIGAAEFVQRRTKLMSEIGKLSASEKGKKHIVVVPSHPKMYMTDEIPYPFRQSTDFLYLCGFQEPDSILILESLPDRHLPAHKATLLVPKRDAHRELWDGPRSGTQGATDFIGVDVAYENGGLAEFLEQLSQHNNIVLWYDFLKPTHPEFHNKIMKQLILPVRNAGNAIKTLEETLHRMRVIKSPAEQELMRQSASIASHAFINVMKFSTPLINESDIYARIDYECRIHGAEFLAYPPVVAGGNRANILHYVNNNQIVKPDELILMDAGCEYHGYASDITRTWPVSGKFTPPQRTLYEVVLDVQMKCLEMCSLPNITLDQIYNSMLKMLGCHLQDLGILSRQLDEMDTLKHASKYCPHHVGHYLGMDTHDTPRVPRSVNLQPGMVITVEPGVYIPLSDTNAPSEYRGIGIRIEDDVLITKDGTAEILTSQCPKQVKDIENLFSGTMFPW